MGVAWGQDKDGEAGEGARADHPGARRVKLNLSRFHISSQWEVEGSWDKRGTGARKSLLMWGPHRSLREARWETAGNIGRAGERFELTICTQETCLNCQVVEFCCIDNLNEDFYHPSKIRA